MPDRKRSATLHVTDSYNPLQKAMGASHCGLTVDNVAFPNPLYVTWDGSYNRDPNVGASRGKIEKSAVGILVGRLEASRRIGFADVRDRHTGAIRDNEYYALGSNGIQEESPHEFGSGQNLKPHTNFLIPARAVQIVGIPPKADDNLFGIDVDAIHSWWIDILGMSPDDPRRMNGYKKMATMRGAGATNCCGMVGRALQIGHLDAYADPPSNLFYQGSASLVRWVKKATDRINKLNNGRKHVLNSIDYHMAKSFIIGHQQIDFNGVCDLPSPEEWKKISEVKAGLKTGTARRKEQLVEIDNIIPQYHLARMSFKAMRRTFPDPITANLSPVNSLWQKHLVEIYEKTVEHLTLKPTSDRRSAMLSLMKTIENILWGYSVHVDRLNNPPANIELYAAATPHGTWE